ncbi:hypothetical protein VPH35_099539 [Triticum aestivum]
MAGAAMGRRVLRWRCRGCNEASPELQRATRAALEHCHAVVAATMEHGRSCNRPSVLRWSTTCRCRSCNEVWPELQLASGSAMEHRRPRRCWRCRAWQRCYDEARWWQQKVLRGATSFSFLYVVFFFFLLLMCMRG